MGIHRPVDVELGEAVRRLQRGEKTRAEREARMMNALEILSEAQPSDRNTAASFAMWVRLTAREGLGRELLP